MAAIRMWSLDDVARRLGVSAITVYRLVRSNRIPAVRVGGRWRFDAREIEGWLRGNHRGPGTHAESGLADLRRTIRDWKRVRERDLDLEETYRQRRHSRRASS